MSIWIIVCEIGGYKASDNPGCKGSDNREEKRREDKSRVDVKTNASLPAVSPMDNWMVQKNSDWAKAFRKAGARVTEKNADEWLGVLERCFKGNIEAMANTIQHMPIGQRWPNLVEEEAGTIKPATSDDQLAKWMAMESNGERF